LFASPLRLYASIGCAAQSLNPDGDLLTEEAARAILNGLGVHRATETVIYELFFR